LDQTQHADCGLVGGTDTMTSGDVWQVVGCSLRKIGRYGRPLPLPAMIPPDSAYPSASQVGPNRLAIVSVVLGVIGLFTSLMFIGIGFGIAAVVTGFIARSQAIRGETRKSAAAVVGIVTGVTAILATVAFVIFLVVMSSDPCWPVKHHTGCY
jgi:hypothetical protein